jgi:hypothetical protein
MSKQYAERDPMELDKAGGYNIRHLSAMTSEKLHGKFQIAGELAYRDMVIDNLKADIRRLTEEIEKTHSLDLIEKVGL